MLIQLKLISLSRIDVKQLATDEATFPFFDCDVADGFVG